VKAAQPVSTHPNIFNVFAILGITALVQPITVPFTAGATGL
jgi:hypothetical protein